MTSFDRFDPFEQRISSAIDEIAAGGRPDYLDDVLRQTARTSQRPRWSFPGSWLPAGIRASRQGPLRRARLGPVLLLLAAALLLAALSAWFVGSRPRVPAPFGPAANGMIVYAYHGDLWARDSLTAVDRILVGGAGDQAYPLFSPDGRRLAFSTTIDRRELLMASDADGSHVHQLLPDPLLGASLAWSPDSSSLLVVNEVAGRPSLVVVPVDGSPARRLDLGDLVPAEASWQPPDGGLILFHGLRPDGFVDLYTVKPDGSGLHALGLAATSTYGTGYTLSGATWAPDGRSILVNAVGLDGSGPAERFRVASIAADGTHLRMLPGPADPKVQEAWPVVSPDGRSILVHRWTWKADNGGQGWLAVMPSDGSAPATDIGPRIPGGEDTGLMKTWSPDGTRVLMASGNTTQVFSIDPLSGLQDPLDWADQLPDWQRVSP